ncbi:hypothetical protein FOA43_000965 [Brettanomyces nanus]|uniref:non-specific serine/threonine protein kinase n=1 Tax=Eeniella nana TaxID=13502 RepID=A0A875RYF5_EENNA|nr:uncharacterized protein FOA43_000965 [Brettanomyces nanus]QPG73653.1 hypothetical protein FOA43_000965 [Brettanomyces nanus]
MSSPHQQPLVLPKVRRNVPGGSHQRNSSKSSSYTPNVAAATPRMLRNASSSNALIDQQQQLMGAAEFSDSPKQRRIQSAFESHPPSFQSPGAPQRRVQSQIQSLQHGSKHADPFMGSNEFQQYQLQQQQHQQHLSQHPPTSPPMYSANNPPSTPQQRPPHQQHVQSHPQFHRKSIGDWDFCKTIGAGSMGKVKLARHRVTGEICAIKVVPRASKIWQRQHVNDPPTADSKELIRRKKEYEKELARDRRTIREGALGRVMYHPYICRLYEMFPMTNHYYMVFEYVSGGQMLDYIVSHGSMKERQARKFCRGIASALDYCHNNNIVHRDLKIENIMISKTGDVKIIDFGLSNMFDREHLLKTYCGSLYFAAPELLSAHPYTGPEVDVWSFGVVLYVLVCGKVPFDDQSVSALHEKIKRGRVQYPDTLSYECISLLSRMLVVDPRNRASLHEVISHPWMTKGYGGPPSNYLPHRTPLQSPLDPEVIKTIVSLDLGNSDQQVYQDLNDILASDQYRLVVRNWYFKASQDVQYDSSLRDPTYGYHPLISIYFLVDEMIQRKKAGKKEILQAQQALPAHRIVSQPLPHQFSVAGSPAPPVLAFPEAAYKSPRQGPHLASATSSLEKSKQAKLTEPTSPTPPQQQQTSEGIFGGNSLLRRLSTKISRHEEKPIMLSTPRSRLDSAIRRVGSVKVTSREKQQVQREHLPPLPLTAKQQVQQHQRTISAYTPSTFSSYSPKEKESMQSQLQQQQKSSTIHRYHPTARGKSLGHGRKQSFNIPKGGHYKLDNSAPPLPQIQPSSDDEGFFDEVDMDDVNFNDEQQRQQQKQLQRLQVSKRRLTDEEIIHQYENAAPGSMPSIEYPKTLFLKGFFSVQTTSTKPLPIIRYDIITVLPELGVKYTEVKGGFVCIHYPSIVEHSKDGREESGHLEAVTPTNTRTHYNDGVDDVDDEDAADSTNSEAEMKNEATVVDFETKNSGESGDSTRDSTPVSPAAPSSLSHSGSEHSANSKAGSGGSGVSNHRRKFSLGTAFLGYKKKDSKDGTDRLSIQTSRSSSVARPELNIPKTPAPANINRRSSRDSDSSESITLDETNGASDMLVSSRVEQANKVHRTTSNNQSTFPSKHSASRSPLKFEIHVVKVPLVGLYGVQFKKVSGNTWLYKSLASEILKRLNL